MVYRYNNILCNVSFQSVRYYSIIVILNKKLVRFKMHFNTQHPQLFIFKETFNRLRSIFHSFDTARMENIAVWKELTGSRSGWSVKSEGFVIYRIMGGAVCRDQLNAAGASATIPRNFVIFITAVVKRPAIVRILRKVLSHAW